VVAVTDDVPRGGAFYEDRRVLDDYLAHRHTAIRSPNLVMEEPTFLAEARNLHGLRILDLGCGDGSFGRKAFDEGCSAYTGIDGSSMMIQRARQTLTGTPATLIHQDIEDVDLDQQFDLVASRMALHYINDLGSVLRSVHALVAPQGKFVMSVVHPVITSHDNNNDGPRTSWTVDNYFDRGPRQRQWFGASVTWYHRPVEDYVTALSEAGLKLIALREADPVPNLFNGATHELQRRRRVPLFLVLHATL
jgi:SAM-dependent methyltransferase